MHKEQGNKLDNGGLIPDKTAGAEWTYVGLSRITSQKGTHLLRPLSDDPARYRPPLTKVVDSHRLEELKQKTLMQYHTARGSSVEVIGKHENLMEKANQAKRVAELNLMAFVNIQKKKK